MLSSIRSVEEEMLLLTENSHAVIQLGACLSQHSPSSWKQNVKFSKTRVSKRICTSAFREFVEIAEEVIADGPIELPTEEPTSPLQIVGSVILTGAITILLVRSFRRRLKDATQKKPLKEQAKQVISDLAIQEVQVQKPPPSIEDTFIGAILAGGIAFVLYQVTTAVDGAFTSKPLPTAYTTRNIAVAVRTIISGLFYLATSVYAANAVGLTLYAFQLIFDPPPGPAEIENEETSTQNETPTQATEELKSD